MHALWFLLFELRSYKYIFEASQTNYIINTDGPLISGPPSKKTLPPSSQSPMDPWGTLSFDELSTDPNAPLLPELPTWYVRRHSFHHICTKIRQAINFFGPLPGRVRVGRLPLSRKAIYELTLEIVPSMTRHRCFRFLQVSIRHLYNDQSPTQKTKIVMLMGSRTPNIYPPHPTPTPAHIFLRRHWTRPARPAIVLRRQHRFPPLGPPPRSNSRIYLPSLATSTCTGSSATRRRRRRSP